MSTASDAGASRCPTCPDGLCPSINTTPHYPEPNDDNIAKAELAIADALSERFRVAGRYEAPAVNLIKVLGKTEYGKHRLPAIYWAIHRLVQKGMLSAHAQTMPVVCAGDEPPGGWYRRGPNRGVAWHDYGDEPAQFYTFIVRAEASLWRQWRQPGSGSAGSDALPQDDGQRVELPEPTTYLPKELRKKLDISATTLNTLANKAGVQTPKRGKRNHRYSQDDFDRILRQHGTTDESTLTKKKSK